MKLTTFIRFLIVILLVLTVFQSGNTQDMKAEKSGQWGVKAAYNYSLLSFHERQVGENGCFRDIKDIDYVNLPGVKIGAFYEKYLSEKLSYHTGADILFSNSRMETKDCFFCSGNLISENKSSVNPGTVQLIIPITFRYQIATDALFLETGVFTSLSFGTFYRNIITRFQTIAPPVVLPEPLVSETKIGLNIYNVGFHAGIGKQILFIQNTLEFKLLYYLGLNNNNYVLNYSMKQSGAEFSIAYRF